MESKRTRCDGITYHDMKVMSPWRISMVGNTSTNTSRKMSSVILVKRWSRLAYPGTLTAIIHSHRNGFSWRS